jgi:hypothetical protein
MSDARPPKDNQGQPSDAATRYTETRKKARALIETARDIQARAHQAFATTRQRITQADAAAQHMQAWRGHQVERGTFPRTPPPHVLGEILLIEDSPADIALFLYALKARALPLSAHGAHASERSGGLCPPRGYRSFPLPPADYHRLLYTGHGDGRRPGRDTCSARVSADPGTAL